MFKFLVRLYVKHIIKCAVDGYFYDLKYLFETVFEQAREMDTEANDSTIYAALREVFDDASKQHLIHVHNNLRR